MKTKVMIAGGGVGGLMAALKLAKCGYDVTVAEQTKNSAHLYKGELLQPKSIQLFEQAGVQEQVISTGHPINEIEIIEMKRKNDQYHQLGKAVMDYNIINSRYNYALMIPHEILKNILLEEAEKYQGFNLIRPARFTGFRNGKALVKTSEQELEIEADVYIGAEGRKSKVREAMNVPVKEQTYDHHFLTVSFPRPPSLTEGRMISTAHTFLGLFPLPDNKVRTVYLISSGEYKEMKEKGIQYFHERYLELCPDLDGYVTQIKSWKEIQLMIPVHFHAEHYVKGNKAIIGDAAHSVHPMAGEGMNLAIQDGDALGELLCWIFENGYEPEKYLDWYEEVRRPRVEHILNISHLSSIPYSKPFKYFTRIRNKGIKQMTKDPKLHTKQMLNISGLGIWKETFLDRMIQVGMLPARTYQNIQLMHERYMFSSENDYPWRTKGGNSHA
ncbi:FAD-binding protein [Bacillus lacus]|uniref:FAD-binding protein n=1 Tax=Metabacillus lacus TaxID=1983721 RepID=A0A7X2IXA1_9BACI|nr:NAD(P)/FAD-dependent oxidoreductase [Metabacillus lacus]MRX71522.1 FAD-binding protein [Metabacillus lacus]